MMRLVSTTMILLRVSAAFAFDYGRWLAPDVNIPPNGNLQAGTGN